MGGFRREKSWRLGVLLVWFAATGGLFWSVDWEERFATDVTVLLPDADVEDETARLLGQLREREEKTILGVVSPPEVGWQGRREEVAATFLRELEASGQFSQVTEGAGPSDPDGLAAAIYAGRFDFVLPYWAEEAGLAAEERDAERWASAIVGSLEEFLTRPEATALAELIPADPFPLAAYLAESVPLGIGAREDSDGPVLWWARQKASPFAEEGQKPIFEALREAEESVVKKLPGTEVRYAGVAAFAAESEKRIRKEITWLNLGGMILVSLVAIVFLRRRAMFLHIGAVAGVALLGGMAAVLLFFPVVHVLSLVVGGLLVGVAVDYGIHVLLHLPADRDGDFRDVLREVRKPLCASALSTAGGFAALAFADLLLLRQIGVFIAGGLVSALIGCWLYFPLWKRPPNVTGGGGRRINRHFPVWVKIAVGAVLVVPLAGWLRVDWRDDVRDLQAPMPELWKADREVRAAFSGGVNFASWICRGETVVEARKRLSEFEESWVKAEGKSAEIVSVARWIAEADRSETLREMLRGMDSFSEVFQSELEEAGFEAEAFAPFLKEWKKWLAAEESEYAENVRTVAEALDGPAGMLLGGGEDGWWFLASAPVGAVPEGWNPPAGIVSTGQLEKLNELFARYRMSAWRLSGVALAVIAGGLMVVYGPAAGAAGLLLPTVAWLWGMGGLFALFSPLTLFHVLGGFLGFCVALDYGLFLRLGREAGHGPPLSIRVSAATTLAAFGLLAFSRIPAVAGLGSSVFAVVLGGFLLVESFSFFEGGKRSDEPGFGR